MLGFWEKLPKPFFVQAPMEDVTDAAFRALIAQKGAPHVTYTEFTSADGLTFAEERGQEKLRKKLEFGENERPVVAQLFTASPERMEKAAALVEKLGFDGIDINMGCPDRSVEKSGCGSAMIKNPKGAQEIIRAAKRGAPNLPVSVKTRIGYAENELATWAPTLLQEGIAALAIHARTRNELSEVPARWEHVQEVVAIRDSLGLPARIIGNGDVVDIADAKKKAADTGADGVMLGRAIYGNPWLYAERATPPTPKERIEALLEHLALFEEKMLGVSNYATMKKHFKAYINGWDGAKDVRASLMETEELPQARAILKALL